MSLHFVGVLFPRPHGRTPSLVLGGNALLTALGFSISFGIFVAAFVMAMFFTPSLTALLGHTAWWPGHGDEKAPVQDAPL
jgi:RND superfamily putative drug exporter